MNYNTNPAMVRVDFFKESGKWYATEQMEWNHYKGYIIDCFIWCLIAQFNGKYAGMTAVCLEPYHENAYPMMLRKWNEHKPSPIKL